jgi:hypothetical protein
VTGNWRGVLYPAAMPSFTRLPAPERVARLVRWFWIPETRGVIELTEPQVWTAIGTFSATMFAVVTLVGWMFARIIHTEIAGVRTSMRTDIDGVHQEIASLRTSMRTEIAALDTKLTARIDIVDAKVEHLSRDVRVLFKHVFPDAS